MVGPYVEKNKQRDGGKRQRQEEEDRPDRPRLCLCRFDHGDPFGIIGMRRLSTYAVIAEKIVGAFGGILVKQDAHFISFISQPVGVAEKFVGFIHPLLRLKMLIDPQLAVFNDRPFVIAKTVHDNMTVSGGISLGARRLHDGVRVKDPRPEYQLNCKARNVKRKIFPEASRNRTEGMSKVAP